MGHIVVITGIFITLIGLLLLVTEKTGLPKLPGDIFIQKENFAVYFPIVTMLLLSVVMTIIINLFRK